jgi:hypothetical protein
VSLFWCSVVGLGLLISFIFGLVSDCLGLGVLGLGLGCCLGFGLLFEVLG